MRTTPTRNRWKLAFFTLLGVIVAVILYLGLVVFSPVNQPTPDRQTQTEKTSFDVSLTKQQLNGLSTYYLNKLQKDQDMKYHFKVTDQAVVTGTTKILGANVNFVLVMTPTVLPNGNIQLKAKSLSAGSLPIPIKLVMTYISHNYTLPKWVALNSHEKTITLDLSRVGGKNGVNYSAEKIDLNGKGQLDFKVIVPK
ncbi:YpmS family protein [Levilactobacillus bambusae]|uniref:DUF2140 domain-containing protein n=1 Tax=Levilactobacillus bambusae TaxID=2024736 RepID=A0A2V1N0S3_9LACO|nr:YpmS family protein [Levilactobacillus bambusae]PWG00814.1 DUF2140 domain-containing protein [Levilactobacillus bambusae]